MHYHLKGNKILTDFVKAVSTGVHSGFLFGVTKGLDMRRALMTALAGAALAAASPAFANPPPTPTPANDPCHDSYVAGAIACQGYYGSNLFQGDAGDPTPADIQAIIALLLNGTPTVGDGLPTDNGITYSPPYLLDYDTVLGAIAHQTNGDATFDFGSLNLLGPTIFGAHFGNNTDSSLNNVSAFWLIDFGNNPTHIVTVSNGQGVSNAQIFATGTQSGVPEPATWAMMLVGLGGVGMAMRRRRKQNGALLQIA